MSIWCTEYIATLKLRDRKEKASQGAFEAYTKLADRSAALTIATVTETVLSTHGKTGTDDLRAASTSQPMAIARVREDLLEAQRNRGELQARLIAANSDLSKLQLKLQLEGHRITELLSEKQGLTTKLRDRDEELRGKTKLLEEIHDETVSLTLQLNMAEVQSDKLQRENEELVDRWMARMGQEAEAMNIASKYS